MENIDNLNSYVIKGNNTIFNFTVQVTSDLEPENSDSKTDVYWADPSSDSPLIGLAPNNLLVISWKMPKRRQFQNVYT